MKLTDEQIDRQMAHYEFINELPNDADMTQACWRDDYERRFAYALRQNDPDCINWFFREFEQEMEAAE